MINYSDYHSTLNSEQRLFGMAYECPYQKRCKDCPFAAIDHMEFSEKVEWVNSLNKDEKENIITHHNNCFQNKQAL